MRIYRYVGPEAIRLRCEGAAGGAVIASAADVERWIRDSGQEPEAGGLFAATFVVDAAGRLRTADRRSEHVACAAGGPVLSAGEMFFARSVPKRGPARMAVEEVTNLSTGYCPEPESWPAVAAALDAAGLPHPGRFTAAFVFRLCPSPACRQRNVVKDGWFSCAACGAGLPAEWNFAGPDAPDGR